MDVKALQQTMIFRGMSDSEVEDAISNLQAHEKTYKKGAFIYNAGTLTDDMGLVLEGSVTVESNDVWGNRTILSHIGAGEFFAETYAILENEPMLVDVSANENCRILFLRIGSLGSLMMNGSEGVDKIVANLLSISAHKSLTLSGRSFHTAPKKIRARVMAYLNTMSLRAGQSSFEIPFDRQQLADYLNLDRTALSKELSRMQDEGLISVHKNRFAIISDI